MDFEFHKQKLDGVILVSGDKFSDDRGFLFESYRKNIFLDNGISVDFVQDNFSYSDFRTLRGLHFQKGIHAQDKLVFVNYGSILDVVVDLRKESPTFGEYLKFELSSENPSLLYISKGFAHGFLTLSDFACVSYKLSAYYCPEAEGGIIWNDKTLNIDWGIDYQPIVSKKDLQLPQFTSYL